MGINFTFISSKPCLSSEQCHTHFCFPRENTGSISTLTLLQMSSPNPEWPTSAVGEGGQAPLGSLHTASYRRYFLSSCPNLFHVDLLTHLCLFFPFSQTGFFRLLVSFCSIGAQNYLPFRYMTERSLSHPTPGMRLSKTGIYVPLFLL